MFLELELYLLLKKEHIENFLISLPNLETQIKIVKFLDIFESLDINLNNELITRSKQFKFYLDLLLWSIKWEEISLWKISNMKTWISFNKKKDEIEEWNKYDENEIYKLLTQWNISKWNKLLLNNKMKILKKWFKEINENDFLKKWEIMMCVNSINYIWKCVYFDTDTKFLCWWFMIRIETISNKILPKFLYYLFNSKHFLDYTKSNTKMSTIWKLSNNLLKQYTFKLPNLETQQKIIDLLDNFDKYIFWITKSNFWLENLIKNNQKLLNYYLDKLVNF